MFAEISVTTASGSWDLDRVAYSDRNFYPVMYLENGGEYEYVQPSKPCQSELNTIPSILSFINSIIELENVCLDYCNWKLIDPMNPRNLLLKLPTILGT